MNTLLSGLGCVRVVNAVTQLRMDHRHIERCFTRYFSEENVARWAGLMHIALTALKVHMALEEELFYPAVLRGLDAVDRPLDALAGNTMVKRIIADLESHDPGDARYESKVNFLWRTAKTDMSGQESCGGMFDLAQRAGVDFLTLGQQITLRREELEEHFASHDGYG